MKERKLKKSIPYVLSVALLGGVLTGTVMIKNSLKEEANSKLVNEPILETVIPVFSEAKGIIRPYNDSSVTILNNYYDYRADIDKQLNSIIFYDNTYMQNTGNIYGSENKFDIVAIADGEVIKVSDSELSGKIIEIKHNNDVISVYQFLDSATVSENTIVKQGDKIGTSGISNLADNTKNQLYLELIVRGELVDAVNYFGKDMNEI